MPPVLHPSLQQAQSTLLPVLPGHAEALEAALERAAPTVHGKLSGIEALHFARLAVLHGGEGARSLLLVATTFDGSLGAHWAELWRAAGGDLAALLVHCEGGSAIDSAESFRSLLERWGVTPAASLATHPRLGARRIQAEAKLRARVSSVLDAERTVLVRERPERILLSLRERCGEAGIEPDGSGLGRPLPGAGSVLRSHWLSLAYLFARSVSEELLETLGALWHDERPPPRTSLVPPALGSGASLATPRSLLHVARLKPGRFRRAALRFALRLTHELGLTREGRDFGAAAEVHAARFILLGDGRLVTLSRHAGSAESGLFGVVDRVSTLLSLVLSQTVRFPPTLGWRFGGARDQARFGAWLRRGEVRSGLEYSAYPELGVREIGDNAELALLLAGPVEAGPAARLLALVKD